MSNYFQSPNPVGASPLLIPLLSFSSPFALLSHPLSPPPSHSLPPRRTSLHTNVRVVSSSLESESPRAVALLEPWYYIGASPQSIVLDTLVGDEIRRYAGAHTSNGRWLALELRRHFMVQAPAQSLGAVADAAITGDARATFSFCKVDEECRIVPYARHLGIECLAYRGVLSSLAGQAATRNHSSGTPSTSATGTTSAGTGGSASVVATQLFSSPSLSGMLQNVALDAASGRLCFIDDDDERNIWIIDFLLPQREG
ncbi:hypothetical protein EV122DRAFT_281660 [Schizophyllum commune]